MIQEKYPLTEIEEMKNCLNRMGWLSNSSLPKDWLYKESGPFITNLGKYFKSKFQALKYLKENNLDSEYEMLKLFNLLSGAQDATVYNETRIQNSMDWAEVEGLAGWQYTKTPLGKSRHFNTYLSPEGLKFKGKRLTYKHMLENSYPKEKCDFMLQGLLREDWNFSEKLPEKWLYKLKKGSVDESGVKKRGHLYLINPTGDLFKNKTLAIKHLKNSFNRTEDVNILSRFSM